MITLTVQGSTLEEILKELKGILQESAPKAPAANGELFPSEPAEDSPEKKQAKRLPRFEGYFSDTLIYSRWREPAKRGIKRKALLLCASKLNIPTTAIKALKSRRHLYFPMEYKQALLAEFVKVKESMFNNSTK